jgi:nicotinate phosphoribosyltransferase
VAREDSSGAVVPVEKRSRGKSSHGGRKTALRRRQDDVAVAEVVAVGEAAQTAGPDDRPLQVPLVSGGDCIGREPLGSARDRHRRSLAELPDHARQLSAGEPAIPTVEGGA